MALSFTLIGGLVLGVFSYPHNTLILAAVLVEEWVAGAWARPGGLYTLPLHQTRALDPFNPTADALGGLSVVAGPLALDGQIAFRKKYG